MIDFHCHIDLYRNPISVIKQARSKGSYILAVTTTPKAWQGLQEILKGCTRIRAAVGLHPELIDERSHEIDELLSILKDTRYVGEIGLDGSPRCCVSMEKQKQIFSRILTQCAQCGGRIMSIHSRSATKEVLDIVEEHPKAGTAVLHWFSGSVKELQRAIELSCWFSIGPAMLNSDKWENIIKKLPMDKILTETDGPFVNYQSKTLMPWDTEIMETALSAEWDMPKEQVRIQLRENFKMLLAKK